MSQCTNCKAKLTCGCQRRTATDGTACCSNCVVSYNAKLKNSQSNK